MQKIFTIPAAPLAAAPVADRGNEYAYKPTPVAGR
jgi:hypothetical protein